MKITLPFTDIIIIESLPAGDRSTGSELKESIDGYVGLLPKQPRVSFCQVSSKADFEQGLKTLGSSCRNTGMIPILHIEIHGCEQGLGLSSGEFVKWEELHDLLEPINTVCGNKLLVTLAVCCGAYFMQTLQINRHVPFWGIVGSFEPLQVNKLLACYKQFYKTYLNTLDLNAAVCALQKANMQTTANYRLVTSVETFVKVYSDYIKTHMSPGALRRRAQKAIASEYPNISVDERVVMERQFVEKALGRKNDDYQDARKRFFGLDKGIQSEEANEIPACYDEFVAKYCHPKISVIVPVYNAEKYLHRCIDSILAQTFTDFDLLLIDDGSKDRSGAICDEYALKDERVRVWHKENGGVSSARNVGLDNARGEWVTFCDSDDWVEEDYLINFSFDYDICVQSYYYGDELIKSADKIILDNPGEDYLVNEYVYGPYCKVFKRKIISDENIRFDNQLAYGEDVLFWLQYLCYCTTMKVQAYAGYHYILYESDTLRNAPQNFEKLHTMFEKHIRYMEILLGESKYRYRKLRKEAFNMFHDLIIDYGVGIRIINSDLFLKKCFFRYLNVIDKIIVAFFPFCINYYKRFLVKIHKL